MKYFLRNTINVLFSSIIIPRLSVVTSWPVANFTFNCYNNLWEITVIFFFYVMKYELISLLCNNTCLNAVSESKFI